MKALVTGAGGFIGSHLVEHLVESGHDVRALVHYRGDGSLGHLDESPVRGDIDIVRGDVRDADRLKRTASGCEVIFNLAALVSIPHSYASPEQYQATNATGCLNALAAARWHGIRLVQMSTSEVYGTAQYVPMAEHHPIQTQSPYAASKAAADALCRSFAASFDDCDVVVARPFNACGPRQSVRAVIPQIVLQLLLSGGRAPVRLGTLTATRDFTHVTDLVRGLVLLAECPSARGREVNIGSGREIPMRNLALLVHSLLFGGPGPEPALADEFLRPPRSEVQRLRADAGLMRDLTGWKPELSLQDAIRQTAEWMRARLAAMPRERVL